VIGVHVLPDQRHFAHAGIDQAFDLADDLGDRPRHFAAARIGDDAEGAELVAAFLHGDESGYAARARRGAARRGKVIELVLDRKLGIDHFLTALHARQQVRQAMIILRAEDQIDGGRAPNDLLALRLGDAAGDRDDELAAVQRRAFLELPHAAELGIDLLGRLLADMAGVEHDQVGVLGRGGLDESRLRHHVRHTLRVVDVHLAAVGLDMKLARCAHTVGNCRRHRLSRLSMPC
jgi:hypothetical protein